MTAKIFIVEDEAPIARFLQIELEKAGYDAATETNGRRALDRIIQEKFDLVLLDLMLPEMGGLEICQRAREVTDVPIIMLTALDELENKVAGLDCGANDYVTKPFSTAELLARIRGILKRQNSAPRPDESRLALGSFILYPERYELFHAAAKIPLTAREFELLHYLVQNKPNVLSRDQILQKVWGYEYIGNTNVVDVYISYLRGKIDAKFGEKHIYTVRGVGYACRD